MSDSRRRTWISAEISPDLMESLESRAKSRGISRSEGLRKALRQWTDEEERQALGTEERGRHIVALLDDLREEILRLGLSEDSSQTSATTESSAEEAASKAHLGDYGGHIQMELHENE